MTKQNDELNVPTLFLASAWCKPAVIIAAFLVGLWVYTYLLQWAYQNLYQAYLDADVVANVLQEDPNVPGDSTRALKEGLEGSNPTTGVNKNAKVLFALLQRMGLKSSDQFAAELTNSEDPYHSIYQALTRTDDENKPFPLYKTSYSEEQGKYVGTQSTVKLLAYLTNQGASSQKSDTEPLVEQKAKLLAAVLARQPGAYERYAEMLADTDSPEESEAPEDGEDLAIGLVKALNKEFGQNLSWCKVLFVFDESNDIGSTSDVVRLLFDHGNRLDERNKFKYVNAPADSLPKREEQLAENAFVAALISRLHEDPGVKSARRWITLVRGYEQCGLIILFFTMLGFLGLRTCLRAKVEHDIVRLGNGTADEAEAVDSVVKAIDAKINTLDPSRISPLQDVKQILTERVRHLLTSGKNLWEAARNSYKKFKDQLDKLKQPTDGSKFAKFTKLLAACYLVFYAAFFATAMGLRSLAFMLLVIKVVVFDVALTNLRYFLGLLFIKHSAGQLPYLLFKVSGQSLKATTTVHDAMTAVERTTRDAKAATMRSRWFIMWLSRALPAVGFVGTVRGISLALSDSDTIVSAQTVAEQAAAITSVSGVLGLAFMSTLLALLLGLITSLLNDYQATKERQLIDELEYRVVTTLDPKLAIIP